MQSAKANDSCDNIGMLHVASWNIAAVNNNPFEYWITHEDPAYYALMQGVQAFIESPANDKSISEIFSDSMFEDLCTEMAHQKISGLVELRICWEQDYKHRKAIKEFLRDTAIGMKRLVSMPDRITNTIDLQDGNKCKRPTVINAYDGGSLNSIDSWWIQWKKFMFHTYLQVSTGELQSFRRPELVCSLIGPILRSKYPAITVEEQLISVPLQILCLAILDGIFVDMMNRVQPVRWERVRRELCDALIDRKAIRVCNILAQSYCDMHIIFIQEAAAIFVQQAEEQPALSARFDLLQPWDLDRKRAQNSLILVDRARFDSASSVDVTRHVLAHLAGVFTAAGDLLATTIRDAHGLPWLLASFHGDSNGLSTQPLLSALDKFARETYPDHLLLVGLDANTYSSVTDPAFHTVESFSAFLSDRQMVSLWGVSPPAGVRTAFSSRTYLQTQLNKAKPYSKRNSMSHQNLKDWILAYGPQTARITGVARDNTGRREFVEATVLPSVEFPSDHAIVRAVFHLRAAPAQPEAAATAEAVPEELESVIEIAEEPRGAQEQGERIFVRQRSVFNVLRQRLGERSFLRKSIAARVDSSVTITTAGEQSKTRDNRTLYDYWGIGYPSSKVPAYLQAISERPNVRVEILSQYPSGLSLSPVPAEVRLTPAPDEPLAIRLERFCEEQFVQFVSHPRDNDLDLKPLLTQKSHEKSLWVMFSSRPFCISVVKPWGVAAAVILATVFFLEAVLFSTSVLQYQYRTASYFRFSLISTSMDSNLVWEHSDQPGLLYNGCKVGNISYTSTGLEKTLSLGRQVPVNGWYFMINYKHLIASDFSVEFSNDGSSWQSFGHPPWIINEGFHLANSNIYRDMITRDLRPSWIWIIVRIGSDTILAIGCFGTAFLGYLGRGRKGVLCLAITYFVVSFITALIALYMNIGGSLVQQKISPVYWAISAFSFLSGLILVKERYALECYPIFNSCIGASALVERLCYFPNDLNLLPFIMPGMATIFPALTSILFVILRYFTSRWLHETFVGDEKAAFGMVWSDLVKEDIGVGNLRKLQIIAHKIQSTCPESEIRQRYSKNTGDPLDDISKPDAAGLKTSRLLEMDHCSYCLAFRRILLTSSRADPSFIYDLSQLFRQAACLDILLREKIRNLGMLSKLSNGFYKVKAQSSCGDNEFQRWSERKNCRDEIEWSELKPPQRALEKLMRCYDFEVSRLLDICRQTIYFESVEDLSACLESIFHDKEFKIVRLKQRLDAEYDSSYSGGYRNTILNIRIDSDYSRRLGVDSHICELQLSLISFAKQQNDQQHDRYLILRNCRDYPSIFKLLYSAFKSSAFFSSDIIRNICSHTNRSSNTIVPDISGELKAVNPSKASDIVDLESSQMTAQEATKQGDEEMPNSEVHPFHASDSFLAHKGKESDPLSRTVNVENQNDTSLIQLERSKMIEERFSASTRAISSGLGHFHGKHKALAGAVSHASFGSIWDTSHPFAAALCKQWLPFLILAYAGYLIWDIVFVFSILKRNNTSRWTHFRFTPLEYRGQGELGWKSNTSLAGVGAMGILMNGCPDDGNMTPTALIEENSSLQFSYSNQVTMNGWWFRTAEHSVDMDPVRFKLEASQGPLDSEWQMVGASNFEWLLSGSVLLKADYFNTTTVRNEVIRFDMSVPLIWSISRIGKDMVLLIMSAALFIASLAQGQMQGRWIVVICFTFKLALDFSTFIYCLTINAPKFAFVSGLYSALALCTIVVFLFSEKSVKYFFIFSGTCYLLILGIYYTILLQDETGFFGGTGGFENPGFLAGVMLLLIAVTAQLARIESRLRARNMVKPDIFRYNRCFSALINDASSRLVSEKMYKYTEALTAKLPKVARQDTAHIAEEGSNSARRTPLRLDIDQLFAQAAVLDIYLKRKVYDWGISSNGFLPVSDDNGHTVNFQRCNAFKGENEVISRAKWAKPKTAHRAVEKLHRSYSGDVSRLLDCCRQSIYFDTLDSLFACLQVIVQDTCVELIRVNNRLHLGYPVELSAGYRDVCLNLRLSTIDTRRLLVHTHVCEIQLLLIEFARIKVDLPCALQSESLCICRYEGKELY